MYYFKFLIRLSMQIVVFLFLRPTYDCIIVYYLTSMSVMTTEDENLRHEPKASFWDTLYNVVSCQLSETTG